jgi:hypothetical protein
VKKAVTVDWKSPEGVRRSMQPPTLAKPPAATPAGAARGSAASRAPGSPTKAPAPPKDPAPAADEPSATPDVPDAEEAARKPGEDGKAGAPADARLASRVLFPWPAGSAGYHVYEVPPRGAGAPAVPPPPAAQPYPRQLTPTPLAATTFTDRRVEYGSERCYEVRTIETVGSLSVESASSQPVCVTPVDVFAPAAPRSLGAVAGEGVISLIWEANTEPDLAGYIVLRAVAPGAPTEPITPAPIRETTFRDTTVTPGARYVYAVVAVDGADPPNASPPSNTVEETAR